MKLAVSKYFTSEIDSVHVYTYTHTHTRMHTTLIHACAHAHTHTYTHTHTHTHTHSGEEVMRLSPNPHKQLATGTSLTTRQYSDDPDLPHNERSPSKHATCMYDPNKHWLSSKGHPHYKKITLMPGTFIHETPWRRKTLLEMEDHQHETSFMTKDHQLLRLSSWQP